MIYGHAGSELYKEEDPTFRGEPPNLHLGYMLKEKLEQERLKVDMVNHPPHYDLGGFQVIDIRDILLQRIQRSGVLDYRQADYWSRAWEYLTRFMEKGGAEDLKKGKFYLDRLVKSLEK
jgi:hypothetical protein